MNKFKIVVMGTRGKSSVIRNLHKFFCENSYSTLSKETGLFPLVYDNAKTTLLKREGSLPLSRALETKVVLDKFDANKHDILIFENNSIIETYLRSFNEIINPDVIIITTISIDHILDQGGTLKEVAETYLNSISSDAQIIFWTNHKPEYKIFKEVCEEKSIKDKQILFSPLSKREETIFKSLRKILDQKGIKYKSSKNLKGTGKLPSEIFAKINGRDFINIGHINDVVHTALALDEIMARMDIKKVYLLFNFRADRLERVPAFIDAFLPLFKDVVEGIIIRSDSISLTNDFLIKSIKKKYFSSREIEFYECDTVENLIQDIVLKIPKKSTIVMVGNTADEFGYQLINRFKLFRESYPILNEIDIETV